jgi:hypothetical protein
VKKLIVRFPDGTVATRTDVGGIDHVVTFSR